jgi:superfamily II DNA or RNA helicase
MERHQIITLFNGGKMKLRTYQKDLISKTREAFRNNNRLLVVLPCGAGKTVCFADMAHKHIEKFKNGNVWFLVHRQELIDQTIETFKEQNIPTDSVFIGMVQTITRHLDEYDKPTLIIYDEAHHAKAKTWYNIVDYFNDVPQIGLTATPVRRDGKPLGDIFDKLIVGATSEWLIDNGYLAAYDYYAPQVSLMEYQIKGTDYDLNDVTAQLLKSKIYGDIGKYIDESKKTIIYCPSIKFSKIVCERYGATHFDGNTPKKERDRIVSDFRKGKIMLLSNVDLIGEGFDIPDCEVVILLRPTMSLSLYIQQSMRCLRPGPNKRATIYDLVGNVYKHGMPTEDRDWSIDEKMGIKNKSGEPEIIVRQCKNCRLVYSGNDSICPYCGNDNGETRKQIEEAKNAELEKIEKIEKRKKRMEVGRASNLRELIAIGKRRGYKNPSYWAKMIIANRHKRI